MVEIEVSCYDAMESAENSEDEEEKEDIFPFLLQLGFHGVHCTSCFQSNCQNTEECEIIHCQHCKTRMHCCKMEDHLNICTRVFVQCINFNYGCNMEIRRDKMGNHLAHCSASTVVCTRESSRAVVCDEAKANLKALGKNHKTCKIRSFGEDQMDLILAQADQKTIIDSYGYSRKERVRRRDMLNKKHPVLPLRDVRDVSGQIVGPATSFPEGNSSDEERAIEEKKRKKQSAMFANCWMCQYDPASQHLHTLGNENSKFRVSTKKRRTPKTIGPFYENTGLMIRVEEEVIPDVTPKSENLRIIKFGGTLYTKRCLCSVRRDELDNHLKTQHLDTRDRLQCIVSRCPMWQLGCEFFASRLQPKSGQMRYLTCVDSFVFKPSDSVDLKPNEKLTLDKLPVWAICEIFSYLSPVTLRILTMVSKSLRSVLFSFLQGRALVSIAWNKTNGKWIAENFKWEFSKTDYPCEYVYGPCSSLCDHINQCLYSDRIEWPESRVPIVPADVLSPIMGSQKEARQDLYVLAAYLRRGDMVYLEDSIGRIRPEELDE